MPRNLKSLESSPKQPVLGVDLKTTCARISYSSHPLNQLSLVRVLVSSMGCILCVVDRFAVHHGIAGDTGSE
eukprot:2446525-Amphidinium_carterae.1